MTLFNCLTGTSKLDMTCPDTIREVVSPATGLADVDLTIEGITHRMKLPVGSYQYEIVGGDNPCNVIVEIKGMLIKHSLT